MRFALSTILIAIAGILLGSRNPFLGLVTVSLQSLNFNSHYAGCRTLTFQKESVPQVTSTNRIESMSVARDVRQVFLAPEVLEGAGVRVRRSVGTPQLRNLSPFLLLDHLHAAGGAGFPDHPHRGQETIGYIISGTLDHEDFAGNRGTLRKGDLQFMTAGRGIMHSEMPRSDPDGSPSEGLQLWVDLPQHLKSCEPRYRDLRAAEIPNVDLDNGTVHIKVISGRSGGVDSVKDLSYTPVWYLDIAIKPGGKLEQALPVGWNAFAYVLSGAAQFGPEGKQQNVETYHNVVFEREGDVVNIAVPAAAEQSARLVLLAGQVLDQPIVQRGPFVLTNERDAQQAMMDFYTKSNGFERAADWESVISRESRAMRQ
jgi:redox-sensitive bicupin YhaK (pirin superfamily)